MINPPFLTRPGHRAPREHKPDPRKVATRRRIEDILEQRAQRRQYELG